MEALPYWYNDFIDIYRADLQRYTLHQGATCVHWNPIEDMRGFGYCPMLKDNVPGLDKKCTECASWKPDVLYYSMLEESNAEHSMYNTIKREAGITSEGQARGLNKG